MEGPPLTADGRHIFRSVSGPAKLFNEFHPVCALEMSSDFAKSVKVLLGAFDNLVRAFPANFAKSN